MTAPTVSPTRPVPAAPRAPRPSRAKVPALPPLDALDRTHQRMMEVLVALKHLVEHLADQGVDNVARREAKTICGFFANTARQHHADEEALVFPALVRGADPILVQHVLRLQQDHGWLEEDWLELAPQLHAVAEGYSWYELDTLRHGVGVFTALYHEHIALEESLIYPEARRQLAHEAAARQQRLVDQGTAGSPDAG
ncbi:MAG: hemerythrin [Burkholderiales bacterium PBB5]|nr:MAG: hemerythrin [Burkholderiales bacterium PBB5]